MTETTFTIKRDTIIRCNNENGVGRREGAAGDGYGHEGRQQ